MKIEGLNDNKKKVPVGVIEPGQCFRIDEKPQVFMMIDLGQDNLCYQGNRVTFEAVNIETGRCIAILNSNMLVTPVCVESTVFEEA